MFRIDLPNNDDSKNLIANFLKSISKRLSDDHVAVDISVHNASRITKLYGTPARKGQDRPDRPHRLSKLLSVPNDGATVVARELLESVIADGNLFNQSPKSKGSTPAGNLVGFQIIPPKLILSETFPVGGRHANLLSVAGVMRSIGSNEAEILETLRTFNRTRCGNGKPDDELQKIARDYAVKDANLSMKALMEGATEEQADAAQRLQKFWHALQHAQKRINDGHGLDKITSTLNSVITEVSTTTAPQNFKAWNMPELDSAEFSMEYLVDNVLVAGQPCIIAATKKSLKTNIACDLTLSLASGDKFLNAFCVPKAVRVALMTGESGDATIQETLRRIARSKPWINLKDYTNAICSFDLPRLGQSTTRRDLTKFITDNALRVLIIDPAYMCLDLGEDAGNLFSVGKKLRELTDIGHETNCTIVIIHHNKKSISDPHAIPELESIAWSGFQEWARQWLLIGRRQPYNAEQAGTHKLWLNIGGSAGHSGSWALDIEEGSRKDTGGRRWDVTVCKASEAIAETIEQNDAAKDSRQAEREAKRLRNEVEKLKRAYAKFPEGETAKAIRDTAGLSSQKFAPANAVLIDEGFIVAIDITKNGHTYHGFKITQTTGTRPGLSR